MALFRYKQLNSGGLMLMKRWFGFLWRDHENFDNKIHEVEAKLQDHWEKMQALKQQHGALLKKKETIITSISKASGNMKGLGDAFTEAGVSFLGNPDTPKPPENWKDAFKWQKKQKIAGSPGETITYGGPGAPSGTQVWDIPQRDMNRMLAQDNKQGRQQKGNNNQQ